LDGLGDVWDLDGLSPIQVSDGARDLQDAVVGAGAQAQAGHGAFEQSLALHGDVAVLADLPGTQLGVAVDLFALVALQLALAGGDDPRSNLLGAFPARVRAQFVVLDRRHVDVDVDPVKQRPGNLGDIALDLRRGAGAVA